VPRWFKVQEFPERLQHDGNTLRVVARGISPFWAADLTQAKVILTGAYLRKDEQRRQKVEAKRPPPPVDGPSTSVRTVSGGLPERNRRRH
jgi:hypothetical protein